MAESDENKLFETNENEPKPQGCGSLVAQGSGLVSAPQDFGRTFCARV
jgi:hypothetical protein